MINLKKFVKNAIIEDNGRGDLFFEDDNDAAMFIMVWK